ncbi:hypothetical protein [Streptomyces niveus]|uniref:hypothetical protein n=1 Tax=Streptomyces niveus TaxID=193462 RepID=UPI0036D2511F
MSVMSKKFLIPAAILVAVGLSATIIYTLGLPPFEKRGEIKLSAVCQSLGDSTKAASTLETVLPKEPKYTFRGRVTGEQVTQQSSAFRTDCTAYGEEKALLSTETLVMPTQPNWANYYNVGGDMARESFTAGSGAFITADNTVAIQVPCAKPGTIPGGEYSLRVVVYLKTNEASEKVRQGLKDLAVEAARFAHKETDCNLPSKLPE